MNDKSIILITFATIVLVGCGKKSNLSTGAVSTPDSTQAVAQTNQEEILSSPNEVYQAFLVAIAKGDLAKVEQLALPNKDLALLTSNPVPLQYREQAIAKISATPYRVMKVGESVQLRNGQRLGPTAEFESQGWVMISNNSDPVPHILKKSGDTWKVQAGDLIASRKAIARQTR